MSVQVHILGGALPAPEAGRWRPSGAGAVLVFEGVVRPVEEGRALAALVYEVYEPMASRQLRDAAEAVASGHGLMGLEVWHSHGRVAVGRVSLRVFIESAHRKEALAGMDEFIDRLKRDVPIWKRAVWAD